MNGSSGFVYLNLANQWPAFQLSAIDIAGNGDLTLHGRGGGYVSRGVFRGGPFESPDSVAAWFHLQVRAGTLPPNTHVQLYTFAGDVADAPYDPNAGDPFSDPGWLAVPRDAFDLIVPNPNPRKLWIGGILRGDGSATPRLHQMRLEYGRDTSANYLPMLYRNNGALSDFLERFLALHESVLKGLEKEIADLPRLFDPYAAPDATFPSWLGWLAGWLTFDLDQNWPEPQMRTYLAGAFDLFQKRGTIEGLRRYLKIYAGVNAHIQEPGQQTNLWSLGETSYLGFNTMLAPSPIQGAVAGTSATLDQSNLTEDIDFGAALFDDVAHQFCIQVYCAELTRPGVIEAVQAVIDREKPAHTACHVCAIEPRLLIGVQSRVGVDSIVANGPPPAEIGKQLGAGALAAQPLECYS